MPDAPEAIPSAVTVRKGIVRAYDAVNHKADVQIVGSHPTLIAALRVATDIPAGDVVAGRQCTVLFLDPSNQDDALVLTIQGATPSGGGGGATTFTALTDTPGSYAGDALTYPRVNAGETALEHFDLLNAANAWSALQTFNAPIRATGNTVNDDLGIPRTNIGIIEDNAGLDIVYIGMSGFGRLPFTVMDWAMFKKPVMVWPVSGSGAVDLFTCQITSQALNGTNEVFRAFVGNSKPSGSGTGATIIGLDYGVGITQGPSGVTELTAVKAQVDVTNPGAGTSVADVFIFRGVASLWPDQAIPTRFTALHIPAIHRGVTRWGVRCLDQTTNLMAGQYAYGVQTDEFDASAAGNRWPYWYGDQPSGMIWGLTWEGVINAQERGSPAVTPAAGYRALYPKSDGWYDLDSAGVETKLGSGGAAHGAILTSERYAIGSGYGTVYNHPASNSATGTLAQQEVVVPFACTAKNLYAFADTNGHNGTNVLTVMKNGVATAITVTIAAGSTAVVSDTVNTVSFAAGDKITMRHVENASSGWAYFHWSLELA